MSRNFFIILKYSFFDKVKTKSFIVLTAILVIISALLTFGPSVYEKYIAGDDNKSTSIGVVSESEETYKLFESNLSKYDSFISTERLDIEDYEDSILDDYYMVVDIDETKLYLYQDDLAMLGTDYYILQLALKDTAYGEEYSDISLALELVVNETETAATNEGIYGLTYVYKFLMYMVTLFLSTIVANEILEEKSSRAMEVIISSVRSSEHMLAKVISGILYIVSMLAIFVIANAIFIFIAKQVFDDPIILLQSLIGDVSAVAAVDNIIPVLIYMVLMFVVTLFIISMFAAAISSVFTSTSEAQAAVLIITILIITSFMFSILVQDIAILKIGLYIPIVNFFVIGDLLFTGGVSVIELSISLLISIATLFVIMYFGSKIYRYGVLNYSKQGLKDAFKNAFK